MTTSRRIAAAILAAAMLSACSHPFIGAKVTPMTPSPSPTNSLMLCDPLANDCDPDDNEIDRSFEPTPAPHTDLGIADGATDPIPASIRCTNIDGSEFPEEARAAIRICQANIAAGARWTKIGTLDHHPNVWQVIGDTTIYLAPTGWWTTS